LILCGTGGSLSPSLAPSAHVIGPLLDRRIGILVSSISLSNWLSDFFNAPGTKVIVRSLYLHNSSAQIEIETMDTQELDRNSLHEKGKKLNRRFVPDRSVAPSGLWLLRAFSRTSSSG